MTFNTVGEVLSLEEADAREARRRLACYGRLLREASRGRTIAPDANPYLDLVAALIQPADDRLDPSLAAAMTQLPNWGLSPRLAQLLRLPDRRRELSALLAWAIPTEHALSVAARYAPLVEGGAGMGYWAALLRARGHDIVAYDVAPPGLAANEFHVTDHVPWTEVHPASSLAAVRAHPGRTLMLCWPPHDDDGASYAVLRSYRGTAFVYIGGDSEGAAGSLRFHREVALNWTAVDQVPLPSWPELPDSLTVYRRNTRRRPHTTRDRCFECGRFIATGRIGRCDECFTRRPPALAIAVGGQRVEYSAEQLNQMPGDARLALERSASRIC